ncbi:MAG: zf-HC2 domain-containing protein [Lachnospiraceae bacterium]|nr:zf-HC2 domain-containing protein [Lachnospiraceae bacterium]
MDCKEFERKIPAFVANALEYKELKNFLSHVEGCAECREELTIQVLISEGMARLEEGSAFDLQREMMLRMQEAEKSIRLHRMFRYIGITMEAVAVAAVILLIVVFAL